MIRKKLICISICISLLAITFVPTVLAGDENDPEITDNYYDQFGALVEFPDRIRTHIALALLRINTFDFIDIDSAWFYENEFDSDNMVAALKLKDLSINPQRAIYTIHWKYNGVPYCVWSHLYNNGQNFSCHVGEDRRSNHNYHDAKASYDFDKNIITFKFNKEFIGNPQPGDILTKTFAWTALRFDPLPFNLFFSDGELVKDAAPFMENNQEFGRDYIIKY